VTSLLVLLALLSAATLATHRGAFGEVIGGAATPLLVLFGVAVSSQGLGFVTSPLLDSLLPGTQVAMCWLGVIAGLRIAARNAQEQVSRAALIPLADTVFALAVFFVGTVLGELHSEVPLPVIALVAGACIGAPASTGTKARFAKAIAVCCAAAALGILAPQSLGVAVSVGVLGAIVVVLIGGRSESASLIALLGTVIMTAGIATVARVPSVIAGVVTGALLARSQAAKHLTPIGERSERPVRIVLTVIIAASLHFTKADLELGLTLAAVDIVATMLVIPFYVAINSRHLGASSLALALCSSFAAAGVMPFLLPTLVVAIAAIDAVALITLVLRRIRGTSVAAPSANEPETE